VTSPGDLTACLACENSELLAELDDFFGLVDGEAVDEADRQFNRTIRRRNAVLPNVRFEGEAVGIALLLLRLSEAF